MKVAKNFKELEKMLNDEIKKTLQQKDSNVKNVTVYELKESINKNVYATYSPKDYDRQKEHGGLLDDDNFAVEPTKDGVAIYSTREGTDRNGNDVYVAEIIEGYKPYSIEDVWGYGYERPRHYVEPAREKLRDSKDLINALALDLQNMGFKVKK